MKNLILNTSCIVFDCDIISKCIVFQIKNPVFQTWYLDQKSFKIDRKTRIEKFIKTRDSSEIPTTSNSMCQNSKATFQNFLFEIPLIAGFFI